jgi:hypothetical protein
MGMYDRVAFTQQEVGQTGESSQIPKRVYLPPNDIQIHQTQTMLPYGSLEDGIRGKNVNLPPLRLGSLGQPQNDAARSTEARIADNV